MRDRIAGGVEHRGVERPHVAARRLGDFCQRDVIDVADSSHPAAGRRLLSGRRVPCGGQRRFLDLAAPPIDFRSPNRLAWTSGFVEPPWEHRLATDMRSFEPRLESLRGIAALIVAAHHGMSCLTAPPDTRVPLLSSAMDWALWITNPGGAVMFFFVLSGYVLGQSLERKWDIMPFLVRRSLRILPAFVVSVLFAYVCVKHVRIDPPPADTTAFFQRQFWPVPTAYDLWDTLTFRSSAINGPTWSIGPELVGSLFLPFLALAHRHTPVSWQWLLFVVVATILAFTPYRLVVWFYCGFFLPPRIAAILPNWFARAVTFAAGYVLLRYTSEFAVYYKFKTILPSSIGATLMIGAVVSSPGFMTWLTVAPLRFVGRVSYSFYLFHWSIFYLCALATLQSNALHGTVGNLTICAAAIGVTLVVSEITYRFIELPGIDRGKRLLRRPQIASL